MMKEADPPSGFDAPTQLPATDEQARQWQEANRSWWQSNPMRYDWKKPIPFAYGSREYFDEIDRRFFANSAEYLPYETEPFDALIPFDRLATMDVLEIGVGHGSHAQLLARHAKTFTGIDLTEYAVGATTSRMELMGIRNATVRQMDAERLEFTDGSFDFIWTWGVIHHSSNTERVLREMARVLRPGGTAVTMVYNRSFWQYYVLAGFFHGILRGDLFRTRSLAQTMQHTTDGALARYYTPREWTELVSRKFAVRKLSVYGMKAEMFPVPAGPLKTGLMAVVPSFATRFLTNTLRQGSFLVTVLGKPSGADHP